MFEFSFFKKLPALNKWSSKDLNRFSFYALFFFLPFLKPNLHTIILIVFVITTYFNTSVSIAENFKNLYKSNLLLPILYFLIFVLFLPGSYDFKAGLKEIEKLLVLLIIPITALFSACFYNASDRHRALMGFILGNLFAAISCGIGSISRNFKINGLSEIIPEYYSYYELTSLYDLHPTYFGMFLNFSLIIVIYFLLERKIGYFLFICSALVVLLFISLLQVRIIYFSTISTLCVLAFFTLKSKYMLNKKLAASILLGVLSLIVVNIFFNDSFNERLKEVVNINQQDLIGSNSENGVTQRVFLWNRSIEAIGRRPLSGYGTGGDHFAIEDAIALYAADKKDELTSSQSVALRSIIDKKMNSHSQFLADFLVLGLIVGSFLIFLLSKTFFNALKNKDILLTSFCIIVGLCCVTEVLFTRQKGLGFFALFYTFLNIRTTS